MKKIPPADKRTRVSLSAGESFIEIQKESHAPLRIFDAISHVMQIQNRFDNIESKSAAAGSLGP